MIVRTVSKALAGATLGLSVAWAGCDSSKKAAKEPEPVVVGACKLDTKQPGPLRSLGRLKAKLQGDGLSITVAGVPAICGPMFNANAPRMGIQAGDGLFFEACLPEGSLQIGSFERVSGEQVLHSAREQAGVEVTFNRTGKGSYTLRGASTDRVVFSPDFQKADATVELQEVASGQKLQAILSFDCSPSAP
jgi:hypothetical protein